MPCVSHSGPMITVVLPTGLCSLQSEILFGLGSDSKDPGAHSGYGEFSSQISYTGTLCSALRRPFRCPHLGWGRLCTSPVKGLA